jgi:hypothetical protein
MKEYSILLERLSSDKIDGCISVKPSQLGLSVSYDYVLRTSELLTVDSPGLIWSLPNIQTIL